MFFYLFELGQECFDVLIIHPHPLTEGHDGVVCGANLFFVFHYAPCQRHLRVFIPNLDRDFGIADFEFHGFSDIRPIDTVRAGYRERIRVYRSVFS